MYYNITNHVLWTGVASGIVCSVELSPFIQVKQLDSGQPNFLGATHIFRNFPSKVLFMKRRNREEWYYQDLK